jgi:predicted DNA-binding transcriptional regulator AlpA
MQELKPGQEWGNDVQIGVICGVTTMTIYNWDHDPELDFPPAVYIKGKKLRNIPAVRAWMEKHTVRRLRRKNEVAETAEAPIA